MSLALGAKGERIAKQYLQNLHFTILCANYRTRVGEIDVVAKKDDIIYFIEVKTRIGNRHGKPYEAVTRVKQRHMQQAAQLYILQNKLQNSKLRLSVVSIELETTEQVKNIALFDL